MTLTMRQFIFQILKKNQSKFQYYLDELTPRQFVDVYMRLIPYISVITFKCAIYRILKLAN